MAASLVHSLTSVLRCGRGVNPIFGKDLQVASRRRRSYVLRLAYLVSLIFFLGTIWVNEIRFAGSWAAQQAQLAEAAKSITAGIVWFEFLAVQIITVMMMSTAVSEEVDSRTLGALLTTPLSSRQIVTGKLWSRLSQVLLLVATSLPVLAMVRVFGGVAWWYLIVSLCITLVTAIFVGSVTVLFSTLCRQAYTVVVASVLSLGLAFVALPVVWSLLLKRPLLNSGVLDACSFFNPGALLFRLTNLMISPRRFALHLVASMPWCTGFLLTGAILLLSLASALVRRVALPRAMGQPTFLTRMEREGLGGRRAGQPSRRRSDEIRRVIGPPMVWKEMICVLSRRERLAMALAVGIEVLLLVIAYTFPRVMGSVGYPQTHLMYLSLFLFLGILFTISVPAALIGSERESRTWPILLVTPLRDRDLLLGKFVGVLRRCGVVWLLLLAYVVAFTCAGGFHPQAVIHVTLTIVSAVVLLSATGFYFGSRCNRTTQAVTANLILAGVVWLILPFAAQGVYVGVIGGRDDGGCFALIPFRQVSLLVATTLKDWEEPVRWFGYSLNAGRCTLLLSGLLLVYGLVASVFLWRAVRAFRRRIV